MSGHGGKDVNLKGFFCLETDKGDENLYYQQIVQMWKSRVNPEKNKNLLIIVDALYSGIMVKEHLIKGYT